MSYIDNIKTFIRVFELNSMSAAGRDMRISSAVVSARIAQLEEHLGTKLFVRNTRVLRTTEQGLVFYNSAKKVLEALEEAEINLSHITDAPRGTLFVAAPISFGRELIAPLIQDFCQEFPDISIRLRLSDHSVDITNEGVDVIFIHGTPDDSSMFIRKIATSNRIVCASPSYISTFGHPRSGEELIKKKHQCLSVRFPGAKEFRWPLQTPEGVKHYRVSGRLEADERGVLTDWALNGQGLVIKSIFEVSDYVLDGKLIPVVEDTPPVPVQIACLFAERSKMDLKVRLFIDYVSPKIRKIVNDKETEYFTQYKNQTV